MSETNSRTIESYNNHVQAYLDGTPHEVSGTVKDWLDRSLTDLPKNARILEFGSAFGRDASYLKQLGFSVECSDATPAFVELLRSKGFNAKVINAITDPIPSGLDFVLANAVLLHFNRQETAQTVGKIYKALNPGGTFAFTLKQGDGEEWTDDKLGAPRYFCYWDEAQINNVLTEAGFEDTTIWGDRQTERSIWLQIIAKKAITLSE